MADQTLSTRTAFHGVTLPASAAGAELAAIPPRPMLSVAAYPDEVSEAQTVASRLIGVNLPKPGRWIASGGFEVAYSDLDTWFCWAEARDVVRLDHAMAGSAARVDQSCGWAGLRLSGPAAADVLARVTPLDIRAAVFRPGQAARTEVAHMAALVLAREGAFDIWVMRSFARTLHHDLTDAMKSVAAQRP